MSMSALSTRPGEAAHSTANGKRRMNSINDADIQNSSGRSADLGRGGQDWRHARHSPAPVATKSGIFEDGPAAVGKETVQRSVISPLLGNLPALRTRAAG
jgi:hypothetical protein